MSRSHIKTITLCAAIVLLAGCADLQWLVQPGPEGTSPAVEAAGAASVALAASAGAGPAGWVIGGIGAALFIYLLVTRIIPILSVWETKEGTKYQKMGTLIKGEYLILAKPE